MHELAIFYAQFFLLLYILLSKLLIFVVICYGFCKETNIYLEFEAFNNEILKS